MDVKQIVNKRIEEYTKKKTELEKQSMDLQQQINALTQQLGESNRQLLLVIGGLESNKEILDDLKKIKEK